MGLRSWPEPTESDFMVARTGIEIQAEAAGLDLADPGVIQFINNQVAVLSELRAENRQLQSHLHPKSLEKENS